MNAHRAGRTELEESFQRSSQVYDQARITTEHERKFLRDLILAEQHPANQPLPNTISLTEWAMPLPIPYRTGRFPPEIEAVRRLENARRSGNDMALVTAFEQEVAAHREHAVALGHLRLSLNDFLAVGGAASVEKVYERRMAAVQRQRAAFTAKEEQLKRESELAAAWFLALLAAGAVTAALQGSTPEGRALAQAQLDASNQVVAATCVLPDLYVPPTTARPAAQCFLRSWW